MSSYAYPSVEALLRRAGRGVGQIQARASAIGQALTPYAASGQAAWQGAQGSEGALGRALSSSLTSWGQQTGADIGGRLAGIQAPAASVSQFGGGIAAEGAGAGQAVGALSSAEVERLRSSGEAEYVYASALPRLAALAGEQERRGFLQEMQNELYDRILEESYRAEDRRRQDEQTAYDRQQDLLDRRRQSKLDKIERARYRREQKQKARDARIEAAAQKRRDADAHMALLYEMGQDTEDNRQAWARINNTAASQAETARHHGVTEAQGQARINQSRSGGGGDRGKRWEDARADAFDRARDYAESLKEARPSNRILREKARVRLWTEFGPPLRNKGFTSKQINSMLSKALNAAGYS